MGHAFWDIAFTPDVKEEQARQGSRAGYARHEEDGESRNTRLGDAERAFLAERDSFYIASTGQTGWPYIQHRGGPKGFVRVLDDQTLGFADFSGNRQYVSAGNLAGDDRVSIFFMDYANRYRLKLFGHAEVLERDDDRVGALAVPEYGGRVERGIVIRLAAFDWNCPQHITERYALADVQEATARLTARISELETELDAARR